MIYILLVKPNSVPCFIFSFYIYIRGLQSYSSCSFCIQLSVFLYKCFSLETKLENVVIQYKNTGGVFNVSMFIR